MTCRYRHLGFALASAALCAGLPTACAAQQRNAPDVDDATAFRATTSEAPRAIAVTLRAVAFDPALDVQSGPWSPDGQAFIAWTSDRDEEGRPGDRRFWTVDAVEAAPLWDSGDSGEWVQNPYSAEWRPDSTLVLARAEGMFVKANGALAGDVAGIEGEVRGIDVSPDGQTVFAVGSDGAWLIGRKGNVRPVVNDAASRFEAWAWRPDSTMLAIMDRGGRYFVLDTTTATTRALATIPLVHQPEVTGAPTWLANGWIRVYGEEAESPAAISLDGKRTMTSAQLNGVPAGFTQSGWQATSDDGRYIVYTAVRSNLMATATLETNLFESVFNLPARVFLHDFVAGSTRELALDLQPNYYRLFTWAPTHDRLSWSGVGLFVYSIGDDRQWNLLGPEVRHSPARWSPDGRWLVYMTQGGALWLVASDGSFGPIKVLNHAGTGIGFIQWAPGSDRFVVPAMDDLPKGASVNVGADGEAMAEAMAPTPPLRADPRWQLVIVSLNLVPPATGR